MQQIRPRNYHSSRRTARRTTTRIPIRCVKSIGLFIVMCIMNIALCFIQSNLIESIEINTSYFSTRKTLGDIYTITPGQGCEDLNPTIIRVSNYAKRNKEDKLFSKSSNTCKEAAMAAMYLLNKKPMQLKLSGAKKEKYDCRGIQPALDFTGQHDNSRTFYFTVTPWVILPSSVRPKVSTHSQPISPASYTKSERGKVVRLTPATRAKPGVQIIPSQSEHVLYQGLQYGISFLISEGRSSKPFPFICNKVYIDGQKKYIYEMQRLDNFNGKVSNKETLNTFRTLQVIHVNKQKQFQTREHKLVQIYQA